MFDVLIASALSVAGLGFALVLVACVGWELAVSRETQPTGGTK